MFLRKRKGSSKFDIIQYTLPQLHTGKNWYVDFLCYDPLSGKMRRKKYMLNIIHKISDRKRRACEIITSVTAQLEKGWNPWADYNTNKQYYAFEKIIDLYLKYVEKMATSNTYKGNTFRDYNSRMKMLIEYNQSRPTPIIYAFQFNNMFVGEFLDYLLLERDVSARTRNNYRGWLTGFANWMMQKGFIQDNPVESFKHMTEKQKFRSAISVTDLNLLQSYLKENDKHFLLACRMEYYTFIRPGELSNIKIKDLFLKKQQVFITSTISKNRHDGMVGLNDELIKLMIDLDVFSYPSDYYLFGINFKPSEKKADSSIFRHRFQKISKALKFPTNYQFYSLKDSGIRDLANAEGIVVARDQARHSDISTTNRYLKGDAMTVHEETKHFEGNL
jgi:integrase